MTFVGCDTHGDINYDGTINAEDYALSDLNSIEQGDPFPARPAAQGMATLVAVPEPAMGFALAALVLVPRHRRRRSLR
jgi:MYXO-CTERM domain-containing protein